MTQPDFTSALDAELADLRLRVNNLALAVQQVNTDSTKTDAETDARLDKLEVGGSDGGGTYDPTGLQNQLNVLSARLDVAEKAIGSYGGNSNPQSYGIDLATGGSKGGASDEERKNNACAEAKATGRPMILPFNRAFTPNTGFTMWGAGGAEGAFRLVGAFPWVGNQNLEQGTKKVLSWIQPGAGVGLDGAALFVNPGTIFDFHLGHFAVQGAAGGGVAGVNGNGGGGKQFYYGPYSAGRNAYRCSFENIAMNFMAAGFGSYNNPAAFTCVTMTGRMEYLNCWPGHGGWLTAGGSDNLIDCHLNAGPSGSPVQAGRVINGLRGDWLVDLSSMSKTRVSGELFLTANNQWGGLRVRGAESSCYDLKISGAVVEGYKPTGTQPSGPASGTLVRVEGGTGVIRDFGVGQGMAWPAANERAVFEVCAGEWLVEGTTYYTGTSWNDRHQLFVQPGAQVVENGTGYREK